MALDADALLVVDVVECQFNSAARYFLTLQLTEAGGLETAQQRTDVAASSAAPVFTKSNFEFQLPAGAAAGELILRAVVTELEQSEGERKGSAKVAGSAAVELAEAVRMIQQSDDREVVRELPMIAEPTPGLAPDKAGMVRVRLRLGVPPQPPPAARPPPPAAAPPPLNLPASMPADAELRQQARAPAAPGVPPAVELQHKQALIERLLDGVDKRANAVTRCGQEIMELRALNKHQEQELNAQRAAAVERQREMEHLAADSANVANIDLPELQRRHRMLAAAYRADRKRMEQLQALNTQYAASLSTQEQLQSAYATLKEAHRQQATQVLRLQDEAKKVGKYRSTARQQEQIIVRLEGLMNTALKDAKAAKAQAPELMELRGQLNAAKEELSKNREMPMQVTEDQVKLLMRAERAERRAAAVEEEMTELARKSAREIAALKLKLAEKEAQLMGGFGSSANLVLGELGGEPDEFLAGGGAPSRDVSTRSIRLPPRHPSSGSARRLSPRLETLAAPAAAPSAAAE